MCISCWGKSLTGTKKVLNEPNPTALYIPFYLCFNTSLYFFGEASVVEEVEPEPKSPEPEPEPEPSS